MGTYIMEPKLFQELLSVDHDLIFLVLLYPWKAYDNPDCGCILQTSKGYGAGTKIWGILAEFWSRQEVITPKKATMDPS